MKIPAKCVQPVSVVHDEHREEVIAVHPSRDVVPVVLACAQKKISILDFKKKESPFNYNRFEIIGYSVLL